MDDVIVNDTEFLSAHWLAEGFPARLSGLVKGWRAQAKAGGADPLHYTNCGEPHSNLFSRLPKPI